MVLLLRLSKGTAQLNLKMGGTYRQLLAVTVILLLFGRTALAQPHGHRKVYVDQNYKEVAKEKEASYEVSFFEFADTQYFEIHNRSPKGLIEKGKYPVNEGFDLRNCYLQRLWPNGKIRAEGVMRKSWNEGIWKYYDESGILYSTIEYHEGFMTGQAIRYYENGFRRSYTYKLNIRNGECIYFDTSNRIYQISNYSNDSLDGLMLEYFPSGKLKRKVLYQKNIPVVDTWFYEAGNPFNCEKYDETGKLHGRCMMYTPSGKIARLDEYNHGELERNDCLHMLADSDWEGDDCPPRMMEAKYPGGLEKYNEYVSLNQDYPEQAIQWRQQGVITYEFTVNNYGVVEDITEENIIPAGFGLEKESLRLLKKLQRFEPQRINGKPIPVRIQMPYVFILQE